MILLVTLGPEGVKNINRVKDFKIYLNNRIINFVFLSPVIKTEIFSMVNSYILKMSFGHHRICYKVIKIFIINLKSFSEILNSFFIGI